MAENWVWRILCRYKFFALFGLAIFGVQIFLAYKSLNLSTSFIIGKAPEENRNTFNNLPPTALSNVLPNSVGDDENSAHHRRAAGAETNAVKKNIIDNNEAYESSSSELQHLGFVPPCKIQSKETISALHRAKTKDCREHIAQISCAIQAKHFYAEKLPSYCPVGNHTANSHLGCYRDEKEYRLLSGYFANFKSSNSWEKCIQLCLQSGFPYAGVQYGTECFCGVDAPPDASKIAEHNCNMQCSGQPQQLCGGYYAMNIYETGISSK